MTRIESYRKIGSRVIREITLRSGEKRLSSMPASIGRDLSANFDLAWLRSREWPMLDGGRGRVRVADVFSGCGAMTLGISEACRALDLTLECALAVESNTSRAEIYAHNFRTNAVDKDIATVFDGKIGCRLTAAESAVKRRVKRVDILLAGPPCQGHSDLNNHTRRDDPRNILFLRAVRSAAVLEPDHVIIENVPAVRHDRNAVFDAAFGQLQRLGYRVSVLTLTASDFGVPQKRRRTFLVATTAEGDFDPLHFSTRERTFGWACGDVRLRDGAFEEAGRISNENSRRIDYLFDNNLYDLPDECRPPCHSGGNHTYRSMYGRLRWNEPAQTITTGFTSMGQGRFVHPRQRRTLTPHEAARLQFIPDFFSFGAARRTQLAEMIGNAVPPKLTYILALHLLR